MLLLIIAYLLGLLSATAEAQRIIPIDGWIQLTQLDQLGGAAMSALHREGGGE